MKTMTVNIYKFNELDSAAQEHAITEWRRTDDYPWRDENKEALNKFESIFPVKSTDWEYGYLNYINYQLDYVDYDEVFEFTGIRLLKYLVNNYWANIYKGKYYSTRGTYTNGKYSYKARRSNIFFECDCPLTGYWIDHEILQPIVDFMAEPNDNTTFEQLLYECLQSWVYACNKDCEACNSDEYITDAINANDYDFTIDGEMV